MLRLSSDTSGLSISKEFPLLRLLPPTAPLVPLLAAAFGWRLLESLSSLVVTCAAVSVSWKSTIGCMWPALLGSERLEFVEGGTGVVKLRSAAAAAALVSFSGVPGSLMPGSAGSSCGSFFGGLAAFLRLETTLSAAGSDSSFAHSALSTSKESHVNLDTLACTDSCS